jgi:hypothetical protein
MYRKALLVPAGRRRAVFLRSRDGGMKFQY